MTLTARQTLDRAMTEAELQSAVTEMAERFGWSWVHFRPARTERGWRTPVSGPLGEGWPDLVLARGSQLLFVELKREHGKLAVAQTEVLDRLVYAGQFVTVWRPSDLSSGRIEGVLL